MSYVFPIPTGESCLPLIFFKRGYCNLILASSALTSTCGYDNMPNFSCILLIFFWILPITSSRMTSIIAASYCWVTQSWRLAFTFDMVVLQVFLMIWSVFVENPCKTKWLTTDILKRMTWRVRRFFIFIGVISLLSLNYIFFLEGGGVIFFKHMYF